ncbi:MAG: methyltransferase [Syntrophobacteraceae bacterium]
MRNPDPSRAHRFVSLLRYYHGLHEIWARSGHRLYRATSLGAWASSRPEHLYYFFRSINLSRFKLLVDLGCGDGVVACVASLFTHAVGIEIDPDLCRAGRKASVVLGLQNRVDFICGDFSSQRITRADCLFVYPDKPMARLEEILTEAAWSGTLLVYGPHLPPSRLKPVDRLSCGRERLVMYTVS